MNELIKSVHSENDSTVTITLKKVDATFFSILTMSFLYIASPQAIMKYKEKFSENPVGTGPFKFVKWEKGNDVTLSANTEYWDGRPFIDTLIFRPVLDNSLRLAFFREGQIDILNVLNPIDIPTIQNDKNVKLFQQFGMDIACLAMNNSHKPFDDVRVRLAVYHAIDRNKIIDQAYYGFARISKNPIPPMLLGYNENIQDYIYNPERAKQLLKEAGYKKIGKVKFFVPPIARPYLPNPQIVAEIIKNSLKNIGIEVEIISPEWRYYMRQLSKGEHNMALAGWIADIPDSDNFFSSLLNKATLNKLESNNNWTFYKSDKMYELIVKGKTAIDERERSEIYRQACEVFHQDVPWIPLAHSTVVIPMLQSVMDFKPGLAREMKFDKTWINK
jgi:ABC-type transport system substrate-binding protein